ncbi:hypothetical protein BCV72DRAFT_106014 [Rhizopus microsporus var. microsporus]|uniref:Bacterial surface antigen (D15) domain-containing protein n=2 Tax=Rhizopus microsporus TaxID=58291 RepID=A0A2G4SU61_RHIZD|nr:uncharacterized protein RHIMIDRAFT_238119 [Rhizopus microsporus ATCC 52813]ORE11427.1 hypothetical protein BCV72DRAFT_106014 [Rhizopus microsporus var. microsporus]PHZ12309.1 hypothetical protein RHIMIDRAFT_238119 [Rhizopus microsporus ATCC 52813]
MSSNASVFNNAPPEAPLRVNALRVVGTTKTRHSFLNSITSNAFKAETTEEVINQVKKMASQLQNHDVFEEIKIYLDTNHQQPDTVDITLRLKEKEKGIFHTKVNVGDNQAELNGTAGVRNLFGGAEQAYTSFSFGNRTRAAFEGAIESPFRGDANIKIGLFVNGSIRDHSQINAFKETAKSCGIRVKAFNKFGEHQVAYTLTDRDIVALQQASSTVRHQSGSHQKHALSHQFVRDERDDQLLPMNGHYLSLFQEVAGMSDKGDVSYVKHELNGSYHQPIVRDLLTLSTSVRAGLMTHVSKDAPVTDRFYLGGPLSVRGFKTGGIGERDGNDALGGQAYWAAGVSLISAIPGLEHTPVKAHAFANAGSIVTKTTKDSLNELANNPRTSVGFGLILHHSIARIEANYCIPIKYASSDLLLPKLQFGFGLNFL